MGQVRHSKERGNTIFHVALNGTDKPPTIIATEMKFDDQELIQQLLDTNEIGCVKVSAASGERYALLCDDQSVRPYSSIMIWKYVKDGDDSVFIDIEENDVGIIVPYVIKNFLKG